MSIYRQSIFDIDIWNRPSRESVEVQRVSATFISATYSTYAQPELRRREGWRKENADAWRSTPYQNMVISLFFSFIVVQIFPRCYIPIFDGLVFLWLYFWDRILFVICLIFRMIVMRASFFLHLQFPTVHLISNLQTCLIHQKRFFVLLTYCFENYIWSCCCLFHSYNNL